jgi:hypothetical protein
MTSHMHTYSDCSVLLWLPPTNHTKEKQTGKADKMILYVTYAMLLFVSSVTEILPPGKNS